MKKAAFLYLMVALVAGFAGVMFASSQDDSSGVADSGTSVKAGAGSKEAGLVGQARPGFKLGSIDGRMVSADEFDGEILLINFWATWCVPCRKEMPMLVEVQEQFNQEGFEVVGIALDEVDDARSFAEELGVTYTILVGSTDVMQANRDYGNVTGSLPYTVLVDREGIIRWVYLGELKHDDLIEQINALL